MPAPTEKTSAPRTGGRKEETPAPTEKTSAPFSARAELVRARLRGRRALLFQPRDAFLDGLRRRLGGMTRYAVVLWALSLAEEEVRALAAHFPGDDRPSTALAAASAWAAGECTMPAARPAILGCHALAKETDSEEAAALCHALGQACSAVHTPRHALGLPVYELTALVRRIGAGGAWEDAVSARMGEYFAAADEAERAARLRGRRAPFLQEKTAAAESKEVIS